MCKALIKSRGGFSLVETIMGVFILAGALMTFLQALTGCLTLNISNSNLTVAVNHAQLVMEQIKALDYATCIALDFPANCYTFPTLKTLTNETLSHTNVVVEAGVLRRVTVKVGWTEKGGAREYALSTYFSE